MAANWKKKIEKTEGKNFKTQEKIKKKKKKRHRLNSVKNIRKGNQESENEKWRKPFILIKNL